MTHDLLATAYTVLAAPVEGGGGTLETWNLDALQTNILQLLGTGVFTYLVVKFSALLIQQHWGVIVGVAAVGMFVLWFIWFPEDAKTTMQNIIATVTNSGTAA